MEFFLDSKYDFGMVELEKKFLNFVLGDKLCSDITKVITEKNMQDAILAKAESSAKNKYHDCYIINHLSNVVNCGNYYLVNIYGSPFEKIEFVYLKMVIYFAVFQKSMVILM